MASHWRLALLLCIFIVYLNEAQGRSLFQWFASEDSEFATEQGTDDSASETDGSTTSGSSDVDLPVTDPPAEEIDGGGTSSSSDTAAVEVEEFAGETEDSTTSASTGSEFASGTTEDPDESKDSSSGTDSGSVDESEGGMEGSTYSSSIDSGLDSTEGAVDGVDESAISSSSETGFEVEAGELDDSGEPELVGVPAPIDDEIPSCERQTSTKYKFSKGDIVRKIKNVYDWDDCCELCRNDSECFAITHKSSKGKCILLRAGYYDSKRNNKFSSWSSY